MLAYWVSPPSGGTSRPESREASAGTRLNELSVCHIWLPALKRLRLSPAGMIWSSASTLARLAISGKVLAWLLMLRMVTSSGPKRRLKAICSSSVSHCRRKSSTEWSLKASTTASKVAASTRFTSRSMDLDAEQRVEATRREPHGVSSALRVTVGPMIYHLRALQRALQRRQR